MQLYLIQALFCIFIFITGAVVGSFVNVLVLRIPKREDFIKTRSHCVSCGHTLGARDLFPVISWVALGGKCRYCGEKISAQYPLVEALCGVCLLAAYLTLGFRAELVYAFFLFPLLIWLSVVDLKTMTIPYSCTIGIAALGLVSLIISAIKPVTMPWYEHLIGMLIVALPFAIITFFGGMGGGDVQLMAAAGLLLGWAIVPAALVGVISCAVFAVVVRLRRGERVICMGPFLSLGIGVGFLWGHDIIQWYMVLLR